MDNNIKLFKHVYHLTADQCDPQQEMPMSLLVSKLIDIATMHANSWGVGYARLVRDNQGWVLTRLTVEMERMPRVNEHYSIATWVEEYNRHFSQRHMEIADEQGNVIGHARTVWFVIDFATRASVDITKLDYISDNALPEKPCPIAPQGRMLPVTPVREGSHMFTYTDCDINSHVNTVRYVELLLNQFDLDFHQHYFVHRLEMAFVKECRYHETATIAIDDVACDDCRLDILVDDVPHVRARINFSPRKNLQEA
ncbi:MAG: acyl-[acyl-carrier-protein] thioesterase [Muribaculaceae bacterium]|nr:acyl-[acyl-carrier-protein] thioesterase [Muribaculaceae bacterium]